MSDIFEFNHIDQSLSESDIETLKNFYRHYHKKFWCFKKSYKRFKLLDQIITISGICLVIIVTITGGITLDPVIISVLNGAGVLKGSVGKIKNYKEEIEMTKIAFTRYEKVLVEMRSALRGDEINKNEFIDMMKIMDEMIIEQIPLADRSCLVYRYLNDKYSRKTLDMNLIMYRLNDGLIDLLFQTNSNVLKNHLLFSYAFSEFDDKYKTGRRIHCKHKIKKVIKYWIY